MGNSYATFNDVYDFCIDYEINRMETDHHDRIIKNMKTPGQVKLEKIEKKVSTFHKTKKSIEGDFQIV